MAWLTGWSYAKEISLTGQTGAGTLYQVELDIGASAGGDFHLEGHCTNFPQDIEVTDNDGTTLLDFFIEDITADPLKMWVEVADDLGSNQKIWVYYGKSGATTNSDIGDTFPFGDDFPGASLDTTTNWELVNSPSTVVSGGILTIDNDAVSEYIRSKTYTTSYGKAIRMRARDYTASYYPGNFSFGERTSGSDVSCVAKATYTTDEYALATNDGAGAESIPRLNETSDDSYHLWDITWLSNEAKLIRDGSTLGTNTLEIPSASIKIALGGQVIGGSYYGNSKGSYDWIFVRKYNSPEPAFASAGAEQSAPAVGNPYWYYNMLKRRN